MATKESIDSLITSWFSKKMLANLEVKMDLSVGDPLDALRYAYAEREEPMTEMQPKDLLEKLEKGDRTEMFIDPQEGEVMTGSGLADTFSQLMTRPGDVFRISRLQQEFMANPQLYASSSMIGRPLTGGLE